MQLPGRRSFGPLRRWFDSMRAFFLPSLGAVVVGALLTACEEQPTVCNYNLVYGLTVVVTDSANGSPLADLETIVEARDGVYVDTLEQVSATEYSDGRERAGTYSVKVQRPGYRVWEANGIRVRQGECHVIPVRVNARLQAL
jgi:hypothetical protein